MSRDITKGLYFFTFKASIEVVNEALNVCYIIVLMYFKACDISCHPQTLFSMFMKHIFPFSKQFTKKD